MGDIQQPYPGIRPFEEQDAAIFFGREAQTNDLLHKLETTRFVAVVGASGSGKSSLVKAGLVPWLRDGYLAGVTDWKVLLCRPGMDPFMRLAEQIRRFEEPSSGKTVFLAKDAINCGLIAAELRASREGVAPVLQRLNLPESTHFLVIIDQFEELFGFRNSATVGTSARAEAERFVDCLLQSCQAPIPSPFQGVGQGQSPGDMSNFPALSCAQRVWVLLTMRSDFIGNCEVFPELAKLVSDSQFLVPVLNPAQMRESIERPAEVGIIGTQYEPFKLEEGLTNIIINETGDRPDQLPLMQHALMRTWKRAATSQNGAKKESDFELNIEDYRQVGGVDGALSQHAEAAWKRIEGDPVREAQTRTLFLRLCEFAPDGQVIRRRPKVEEVLAETKATFEQLKQIVKIFRDDDRNFVFYPHEELELGDNLDICHEALLRQWTRYREWQVEERKNIEELRFFATQALKAGPLSEQGLNDAEAWRARTSEIWALRFVKKEEWEGIGNFIQQSRKALLEAEQRRDRKKFRTKVLTCISAVSIVVVVSCFITGYRAIRTARDKVTAAQYDLDFARQNLRDVIHEESNAVERAQNEVVKAENERAKAESKANELLMQATNALNRATNAENKAAAFEDEAKEDRRTALDYETRALTKGIGGSSFGLPSRDEQVSLWELARTPQDEVRSNVLENWSSDDSPFGNALAHGGLGLRALCGLDTNREKWLFKKIQADSSLTDIDWTTLVMFLTPQSSAKLLTNELPVLSSGQLDSDRLAKSPFESLTTRVDEETAARVVPWMTNKMAGPENLQLTIALGTSFANLIVKLGTNAPVSSIRTGLDDIITAIAKKIETTDGSLSSDPDNLTNCLRVLSAKVDVESVATNCSKLVEAIVAVETNGVFPTLVDPKSLGPLEKVPGLFEAASVNLTPSVASVLAGKIVSAFPGTNCQLNLCLGAVLGDLLSKTDSAANARLVDPVVEWIVRSLEDLDASSSCDPKLLVIPLSVLSAHVSATNAFTLVNRLMIVIANSQDTDSDRFAACVGVLPELAARLDSKHLSALLSQLDSAIAENKTNIWRLSLLGTALAAMPSDSDAGDANKCFSESADRLVSACENFDSKLSLSNRLGLERASESLVGRLRGNDQFYDRVRSSSLNALQQGNDDRLELCASILRVLATNTTADQMIKRLKQSVDQASQDLIGMAEPHANLRDVVVGRPRYDLDADIQWYLIRKLAIGLPKDIYTNPVVRNTYTNLAESLVQFMDYAKKTNTLSFTVCSIALADVIGTMESKDAEPFSDRALKLLADTLLNANESILESKVFYNRSTLVDSFRTFAGKADPGHNITLAWMVVTNMENDTNFEHVTEDENLLASLSARMETNMATDICLRGAIGIARAATNGARRLELDTSVARLLGTFALSLPQANLTRLHALGPILAALSSDEAGEEDGTLVSNLCQSLDTNAVAGVLKWPFCVGQSQNIVLGVLENKTHHQFHGDVWEFVTNGPAFGITNFSTPPDFPDIDEVLNELISIEPAMSHRQAKEAKSASQFQTSRKTVAPLE